MEIHFSLQTRTCGFKDMFRFFISDLTLKNAKPYSARPGASQSLVKG